MLQELIMFCVFTTKPSLEDLMCDGKGWGQQNRGVL